MNNKKQRVPSRRQTAELKRHVEAIADRGSSNQDSQLTDEEFYRDLPFLASEEEHQQFTSNYGSELIITIPPPKPL
jgi:hypothetical protein